MASEPLPYARPRPGTQPPVLYPDYASTQKRAPKRAPLGPNFTGAGQAVTNAAGEYRFLTIKPGAYPWRNSPNAWRPAHIHLAVFGPAFVTRLNTQMYFPGDPLLAYDPIFQSTADAQARERLIAQYDPALSEPEWALGYRCDLVLRGRRATPLDPA